MKTNEPQSQETKELYKEIGRLEELGDELGKERANQTTNDRNLNRFFVIITKLLNKFLR